MGNPVKVLDKDEVILPIFQDLALSMEEYRKAKLPSKCDKNCGKNDLIPQMFKGVPAHVVILSFVNRISESDERPE